MPKQKEKNTKDKTKKIVPAKKPVEEAKEDEVEADIRPAKKIIEIDDPEPIDGAAEKLDPDAVPPSGDEEAEEVGIDDEDVNPFGDKWEQ